MKVELDKVREIIKKLGFFVPDCSCHEHSCHTCGWNGKEFLRELDKLEAEALSRLDEDEKNTIISNEGIDSTKILKDNWLRVSDECLTMIEEMAEAKDGTVLENLNYKAKILLQKFRLGPISDKEQKAPTQWLHWYRAMGTLFVICHKTLDERHTDRTKENLEHIKTESWDG
jgi:hypothetical protein